MCDDGFSLCVIIQRSVNIYIFAELMIWNFRLQLSDLPEAATPANRKCLLQGPHDALHSTFHSAHRKKQHRTWTVKWTFAGRMGKKGANGKPKYSQRQKQRQASYVGKGIAKKDGLKVSGVAASSLRKDKQFEVCFDDAEGYQAQEKQVPSLLFFAPHLPFLP